MKKIAIGQPYTIVIPNSLKFNVSGNFAGTQLFTECKSQTGMTHPEMSLCTDDQTAVIGFKKDYKIGVAYTFVTTEQSTVVKTYEPPPIKKSIAGQQYFRGEVKKSQVSLFPTLNVSNCISFDQSYYTRTLGQIQIQCNLESKYGNLANKYRMASGSGFGAIQALWVALGWKSEDLKQFWVNDLKKVISKGIIRKGYEVLSTVIANSDVERLQYKKIIKLFKKTFSTNNQDLKVSDLRMDIFIPIMDISGRVLVFNKVNYSQVPLYIVAACSALDPIFFNTPPLMKGLGVLNGDISKNNDVFLRKYNKIINITSVGCPVRYYDKGGAKMTRSMMSLKMQDQKHETDLMFSETLRSPGERLECTPIDEVYQFSTTNDALDKALNSGNINV